MPWYLYLAIKQLFPSGKRASVFAVVSIIGVGLGITVLYVSMCIMNGFQSEIRNKIRDTNGDIRLVTEDIFDEWEAIAAKLESIPEIEIINPYAVGFLMATHDNRPAFPMVWALDPNQERQVIPFEEKSYLIQGSIDDLDDESVFVSVGVARDINANIGDVIDVYTPMMVDMLKTDEVILPRELEVVGIYETEWDKADANTILVSLRLMQDMYGLEKRVHGITIRLKDGNEAERIATEIESMLGKRYRTMTWIELEQSMIGVLAMEKAVIFLISGFIILIAAFLVMSIMLVNVIRKTREIGILGAIGAQPSQMYGVFCLQGFMICTLGTIVGLASSYVILYYITEILTLLFHLFGVERALISYYQFKRLPVDYSYFDLALIIGLTYFLTFLASLIPAWRAAHLRPADALRYE